MSQRFKPRRYYESLAEHADAILLDLLLGEDIAVGRKTSVADVKALQSDLNARLHAQFPAFATGGVYIAFAKPVRDAFLSILLGMIDHGVKVGAWTVDYDGLGHLSRTEYGYLHSLPPDAEEEETDQ
jgi:hypothetical protein